SSSSRSASASPASRWASPSDPTSSTPTSSRCTRRWRAAGKCRGSPRWRAACMGHAWTSHMRIPAWLLIVTAVTPIACGKSSTSPTGMTTLNVMMKDTPFTDAKALFVTFSTVSAHLSGGDFMTLPFTGGASSRTCDLKKLTSAQDVLGTGPLATGHYTQVRVVVSSAVVYFDNAAGGSACAATIAAPGGASANVTVPSGEVKLNREFDVSAATTTTMLLDFNGDQSVRQTGNGQYSMTPVIAVASVQ